MCSRHHEHMYSLVFRKETFRSVSQVVSKVWYKRSQYCNVHIKYLKFAINSLAPLHYLQPFCARIFFWIFFCAQLHLFLCHAFSSSQTCASDYYICDWLRILLILHRYDTVHQHFVILQLGPRMSLTWLLVKNERKWLSTRASEHKNTIQNSRNQRKPNIWYKSK